MTAQGKGARGRTCPICGKPASEAHKPFCSVRCADVDLNRWLGGVYRIPTEEAPVDGSPGGEDPQSGSGPARER